MNIWINNKQYEVSKSTLIKEVFEQNNIKLNKLSKGIVELVDKNILVNSNNVFTYNEMKIQTHSSNVYKQINKNIENEIVANDFIKLDINKYNILLCKPELYEEACDKYQDKGFNDIVNARFSDIILAIELADLILNSIKSKLDKEETDPIYIYTPTLIDNKYLASVKPSEEIASTIIKTYIANRLNLQKDIRIYYYTDCKHAKISTLVKEEYYPSQVDYVLLKNHFEIETLENNLDSLVSKNIYLKECDDFNKSITFHTIVELISKMGLKLEALELYQKEEYLLIDITYKGIKLKYLVTKHIMSEDDILNSKVDVVFSTMFNLENLFIEEPNILKDYNVNRIYRKFLIKPGYSDIFRR